MENERTAVGPRLRVPLQAVPVTRALVAATLSDSADGVGASKPRELACALSAGAGSWICFGAAGKCYDALYKHCMGN